MSVPTPPDKEGAPIDAETLHAAFRRLQPQGDGATAPNEAPQSAETLESPEAVKAVEAAEAAGTVEAAGTARRGSPQPRGPRWRRRLERLVRPGASATAPAPGIHQFVPNLHAGDAVGRHTQRLRDSIIARGIPSRIYVQATDPETASETEEFSSYPAAGQPEDVLVYQFATASDLAPWLVSRPETLVINYHNVTPSELFAPWDGDVVRIQQRARAELHLMASRTSLAIADSSFNVADLSAAGFGSTAVVPPIAAIDLRLPGPGASGDARPETTHAVPRGRGARWLCVGRLAPNKAVEDALKALVVTRAHHDPAATLTIVGKPVQEAYSRALHRFVSDTGLGEAVTFRGHVSDDELASAFARADVLVVPSVHEGFCVPLVEAMAVGLPVVASEDGVSSDVLGGAGIMVDTHDPELLAGAIAGLLGDPARYDALVAAGRDQLRLLDLAGAGERIDDLIVGLGNRRSGG
jgi:L-malate glycosyltransferase